MSSQPLPKSPREDASWVSKLLFWWLLKLLRLGYKRDLELSDLFRVPKADLSNSLGDKLSAAWEEELILAQKSRGKRTASLRRALIKVFGWSYAFLGIFAFTEECFLKIIQPICLGYLIRFFGGEFQTELNGNMGYVFASGLVLGSICYTFMHHPFFFETQHVGMRMRVACSSVIYRKSLKLSQSALGDTTIGQLVNLLSNDVNRFDIGMGMLHYIWIGPIQLGIVIYILWSKFGWSCLVGVALLVLFVPFQSQMGKLFGSLRVQVAIRTDRRVRVMNEIISAMRVIKMYTWERPFALLVAETREDEVKYIKKTAILKAINLSLYYISSKIIVFLTLLSYVLTGNFLTAEKVFVTLSLYNSVRLVMTLFFPNGVAQLAELFVSVNRLQNFLMMENRELSPQAISFPLQSPHESGKIQKQPEAEIRMKNVTAKWTSTSEEPTLTDITLNVKRGQLLGVIGPVGCGKGSLLQAILRELPITSGTLHVSGKVAYTSQEPWIFGGSIKENIIFGASFDAEKYERVIQTCALSRDLSLLPFGDNTLVGDRGTSLSGGQKARVNLARAVYADSDIYLLDDPLSAVDAEVGRHLFENCILDTLKDKVRILVTHQLQFLKAADEILLLDGGRVAAQGTYTELLRTGINFAQLLRSEETTPQAQDLLEGTSQKTLKYKGTGMEVLTRSKSQPQIRRSASMSIISEMGALGNPLVPEEFEWEEEPAIMRSYGQQPHYDNSRRMSKPLVPTVRLRPKKKSLTSSSSSSGDHPRENENSPLIPKVHEEQRSTGDISVLLYWRYIRAGSSLFALTILFFSNILVQILFSGSDYWLQYWTKNEEARFSPVLEEQDFESGDFDAGFKIENSSFYDDNGNSTNSTNPLSLDAEREMEVWIYSGIIGVLFVVSLIRTAGFLTMCLTSSINLHKMLFNGVLRAPMRFFEINPVGRILNRFAKDCGIIDETLPSTLFDTMDIFLQFIGVIVIVCTVNQFLLIPSAVLGILFYFVRRFYLETARSVKRLEGIARSPVFSHLSTSLYGLTTIRAFGVEGQFERQFDAYQDLHSSSWYLFLATARWLGIFVDWCSVGFIAAVTFSFLFMRQEGAAVGLAISSAMTLTGMFQWGVRQSAETENHMVSVERVLEYAALEPEAALVSSKGPPKSWPLKGQIVMKKVTLRYGEDAPVLREISCTIVPKEKVGIVGRTGAGKSSLITALFRIAEPCSGTIEIDGIDVMRIGLHELRSKISIIPQDPVLFIGTLRRNLDPFNDYDDDQLWQVLEEVHLVQAVREMQAGLDTQIAEGGSNFSVGQRQLICLGRAILRRNKVLILDEATANVDPETDALIQRTIREKFADCTVLTVAHRLHTVMDSDRILVLDAGRIMEFDEPYKLLLNTRSSLHQLVQQTGKTSAAKLINVAKGVHDKKQRLSMTSVAEIGENGSSTTGSNTSVEDSVF